MNMKKLLLFVIAAVALLASCNDYETYGDLKEKERNAITKFISDSSLTIISEDQFIAQGYVTNVDRREFVKLSRSGVYMQIINKGCGEKLKDGESANLCCRFKEFDIKADSVSITNRTDVYANYVDIMRITRNSGTFTGTFSKGVMMDCYGSSTVPPGWLVPFNYINVGRQKSMTDQKARVRLIVPHSQGHATASSNVKPYYYEISFEKEA